MQTFEEALKKSHTSCFSATFAIDKRSWEMQQNKNDTKMKRNGNIRFLEKR